MFVSLRILALAGLALCAVSPASAVSYSSLWVFGDSLVDSGNAATFTGYAQANPAYGYYMGRFSNGLNFADDLAPLIGAAPISDALHGGTNFAVGGATAEDSSDPLNFSFNKQVASVIPLHASTIPSDALVLVTFGGNDVRDTIGTNGTIDFTAAIDDFAADLADLYALGARNFLIVGAPDIGLLPDSYLKTGGDLAQLAALSTRSEKISALMETQAVLLDALAGTSVSFFDLYDYEHQLLADPAAFGLPANLNTTTPCINPFNPAAANCSASLYFDTIHPTAPVHQAIANAIVAQLDAEAVPEPATWVMMILGFGAIGFGLRRRGAPAFARA